MDNYDIVIIGASLGGVQAAVSACSHGFKVYLSEETDWVGGQMSAQAVPPDEHRWVEEQGITARYRAYRNAVREHYRSLPTAEKAIRDNPLFWTGQSWVSRLAHEPTLAAALLMNSLRPFIDRHLLTLELKTVPVRCDTRDDRVRSVTVRHLDTGAHETVRGDFFLDATDQGDLLPLAGSEYRVGAESKSETGEPGALDAPQPQDIQPVTWVAALEWDDSRPCELPKPEDYDRIVKRLLPEKVPAYPQLGWVSRNDATGEPRTLSMMDNELHPGSLGLWTYRRIICSAQFTDRPNEVTLYNCSQNDYYWGNLIDCADAAFHREQARQLALCTVWWLQHEAPHMDGSGLRGYPVHLCPRVTDTPDGLAKAPYIRESRRMKTLYTIPETDCSKPYRDAPKTYTDSVGVGHYAMDLHTTTLTHSSRYLDTWRFEIPLGALVPVRMTNLLPACKNIGSTHLTNGCYRLHPVEWNIGEAAGHLAAFCMENRITPQQASRDPALVARFQRLLEGSGIQLHWRPDTD